MSRKPTRPGGRKSVLSDEDHELWEHTVRSLAPLKKAKSRVRHAEDADEDMPHAVFAPREGGSRKRTGLDRTQAHKDSGRVERVTPSATSAAELSRFDPRNARKLRRGHTEIEARIDLHGMRQAQAHAALSRFLISSAAQGKRWVLVITGKGGPPQTQDAERHRPFDEPERGVLKRNVPLWLAEPDLRPLVVSFTPAAAEHGGSGAIYVHLRRTSRDG